MSRYTQQVYGDPVLNAHIAEIIGQRWQHNPTAWVNADESQKYSYICGSIVMPSMSVAGYLMVAGVRYGSPGIMDMLEEYESDDAAELIAKAIELQTDYGPGVIDVWIGDTSRLMSLAINDRGESAIVSYPINFDKSDCFQIYIARLKAALIERNKSLYLHDCSKLRNEVLTFRKDSAAKPEAYPALYAAGGLIHTVLQVRPWESAHKTIKLIETVTDDLFPDQMDSETEIYGSNAW